MKKFFATTLAVTMAVATFGTTAFAEEATPTPTPRQVTLDKKNGYDTTIKVTGTYIDEKKSDEIISMNVEWGAMSFTYAATQQGTWDPGKHDYDYATDEAAWVGDTTSNITVTNHSNVDVTASFEFEAAEEYSDVTGMFKELKKEDAVAAETATVTLNAGTVYDETDNPDAYKNADNATVEFEIGGEMDSTVKDTEKQIGTITVSVNKTESTTEDSAE